MVINEAKMGFLFQSPRGDFGFLKGITRIAQDKIRLCVSIPSRGFWFFEEGDEIHPSLFLFYEFQSPRGDFGFLKFFSQRVFHDKSIDCFNPLAGILVF